MKKKIQRNLKFHTHAQPILFHESASFKKIAISVDFSTSDNKAINKALQFGGHGAEFLLVHVLESTNAVVYGEDAFDMEREQDYQYLKLYQKQLQDEGYKCDIALGFGNPKHAIPNLVNQHGCDMLVMGTHGHKTFMDILLGTTVESVRHNINVPLVLVSRS
jgi:manganese transport protein